MEKRPNSASVAWTVRPPGRGDPARPRPVKLDRKTLYHDPDMPPRHAYVAFYLWLRCVEDIDAMIHLGAHGTLEWLPGKAVAQSEAPVSRRRCWAESPSPTPSSSTIPGEAAAAKRRLGAVTIGHLTPPLKAAGSSHGAGAGARAADRRIRRRRRPGCKRRTGLLRGEILDRAETLGLLEECGAGHRIVGGRPAGPSLDTYLCDVKDLQIRDGLHVFGRIPNATSRRRELLSVASKRHAAASECIRTGGADSTPAPPRSGRPCSMRSTAGSSSPARPARRPAAAATCCRPAATCSPVDPRAVPNRMAPWRSPERAADAFIRRHLQETGDWPRALMIDLVGQRDDAHGRRGSRAGAGAGGRANRSGVKGSGRVTGFEIVPVDRSGPAKGRRDAPHLRPVPRRLRSADRDVRRGGPSDRPAAGGRTTSTRWRALRAT